MRIICIAFGSVCDGACWERSGRRADVEHFDRSAAGARTWRSRKRSFIVGNARLWRRDGLRHDGPIFEFFERWPRLAIGGLQRRRSLRADKLAVQLIPACAGKFACCARAISSWHRRCRAVVWKQILFFGPVHSRLASRRRELHPRLHGRGRLRGVNIFWRSIRSSLVVFGFLLGRRRHGFGQFSDVATPRPFPRWRAIAPAKRRVPFSSKVDQNLPASTGSPRDQDLINAPPIFEPTRMLRASTVPEAVERTVALQHSKDTPRAR